MKILAIETSCDETAAAIVEKKDGDDLVSVLSETKATSEKTHTKTRGVVPELAAREQLTSILPVIDNTIHDSGFKIQDIDAIAVTVGPGLIGSLLVGVETAKTLAMAWQKPLIPVNHLVGHLYANFVRDNDKLPITNDQLIPQFPAIGMVVSGGHTGKSEKFKIKNAKFENKNQSVPSFPALGLVVSGGHTDLVLMKSYSEMEYLGGTRDDAAGECFDKCARVILDVSYPGGPAIAAAARLASKRVAKFEVKSKKFEVNLPRPMIHDKNYDFSFSGLKTAVVNKFRTQNAEFRNQDYKNQLAWELQEAVVEVLVTKLMRAVEEYSPVSVIIGGGVAANTRLRELLEFRIQSSEFRIKLFIPPLKWCSDNAVMIGSLPCVQGKQHKFSIDDILKVKADPGLSLGLMNQG